MKIPFDKPFRTYDQQIEILRNRGMIVPDEDRARRLLEHFEESHEVHRFRAGTSLDDVVRHYEFDRELRLLILDAIERIEVSFRSHWAYRMAQSPRPHSYLDVDKSSSKWIENLSALEREVKRSSEIFIKHFREKYSEVLPPAWAVCEVMSFGLLSRWYADLKPMNIRTAIASAYSLDEGTLKSWLHHLTTVRNLCAHHARVWNKEFTLTPQAPRNKPVGLRGEWVTESRRLFNTLLLMDHLISIIAPDQKFAWKIRSLLESHKIAPRAMGFPAGWDSNARWHP